MWTTEQIRSLFDFLRWGDVTMLDAASSLPDEEYYKERNISIGSIHKLLVHAMAAEWLWLQRWQGRPVSRIEDHTDYPTRQDLANRWPVVHLALTQYLDQQTDKTLAAPLSYKTAKGEEVGGPLGDFLFHIADHGTYHRGQLNTMIKQAGGKPISVGYRQFLTSKAQKKVL